MENEFADKYEHLLVEERELTQKIATCEQCVTAVLGCIEQHSDSIHLHTVEDVVGLIHTISSDLQTELLHLRLEKSVMTSKLHAVQL
ncbi:hypothetical protein AV654_05685 [Paenibacillus elgii]|uniref:Uncharacterized protein n=1 Tax=Paenibacillus elgii TaxID=189691 RepID=A0A163TF56_9BACL|nr:hypothetical protein [Paenibacillus elgii]KZE71695.1 hypothetical protein AV654_05685 [Paenibacillus elgii]